MARLVGWFFFACISILIDSTEKFEESVTCAAWTPAISGSQSAVHCYFTTPLKRNDSFSVELHQLLPGSVPTESVDCYYGEKDVDCNTGEGYEVTWANDPGLTVKLTIKNASQSHSGRYVCKKTSVPLGNHKGCILNVKEKGLSKKGTSCSTTGQVEGQPSTVNCHLSEDPGKHKHYFNVQRYDFGKTNSLPRIVLACDWSSGSTKLNCDIADGYTFYYKVKQEIIVFIINTTKSHEGRYFCDDAPSSPDKIGFCNLTVKGLEGHVPGRKVDNKNEGLIIVMAVLFSATICSLLIVGFVCMTCKTKKRCLARGQQRPPDTEGSELSSPIIPEPQA